MKAAFAYKAGPITTFADGEVALKAGGLEVKFPAEVARKLKLKHRISAKGVAKTSLLYTIFGPAAISMEKTKPVVIPYEYFEDVSLREIRYGIFGKKMFINAVVQIENKRIEFTFAPFRGTVKRTFQTEEFYEDLMSRMSRGEKTKTTRTKRVKRVKRPTRPRAKRKVVVEEEPEEYEEEVEEEIYDEEVEAPTRAPSTSFKFCPSCGGRLKSGFKFCPYCGLDLTKL